MATAVGDTIMKEYHISRLFRLQGVYVGGWIVPIRQSALVEELPEVMGLTTKRD